MVEQFDEVDFALAAYRTDGEWVVAELTHDHLEDVDVLASALRRFPGDAGTLGLVAIDEDFFVLVRVSGGTTRLLLSDVTAAEEWELAASVLEHLQPLAKLENPPRMEGRFMSMILVADREAVTEMKRAAEAAVKAAEAANTEAAPDDTGAAAKTE